MRTAFKSILVLSFLCACQNLVFAQLGAPQKSGSTAVFTVPTSAIKMKQIGKFSLPSIASNQLKKGLNVIKFSSTQVFEIDSVVSKATKVVLISGTGVRTALSTTSIAFQCSGGTCTCRGDVDCNNLFSTNACQVKGSVVSGSCIGSNCMCQMKSN
jgi:hypothetical protein